MKIKTIRYFLVLILSFLCFSANAVQLYFSPITDLEQEQVKHFSIATKSIDVAIYSFSSQLIRDTLVEKAKQGVKVRILIDDGNDGGVQKFIAPLAAAGVEVRTISAILHHKFSIVDGTQLANSSGNLGTTKRFDENLMICNDCAERLAAYQTEFNSLLMASNPAAPGATAASLPEVAKDQPIHRNYDGLALFTSSNFVPRYNSQTQKISLVAKPLDGGVGRVDSVLVQALNNAKSDVQIASDHFRSKPLFDAVVAAVKRGVKITMVLDDQEYLSQPNQEKQDAEIAECMKAKLEWQCYKTGSYFSRLATAAGAEVYVKYYSYRWYYPYSQQMHHKYMIIDSAVVYSGSYNWSYNAEYETAENVSIYSGPESQQLIDGFKQNFNYLLNYGGGSASFTKRLDDIKNATSPIPLHFDAVTLTLMQIDQLLGVARLKCPSLYQQNIGDRFCRN